MQTQVLEYMGELLPDGHLSVPPDIFGQIEPGQKLKVRLEHCIATPENSKELSEENDMLQAADQDWSDWVHPDEDIYEEYRQYVK